MNFGVWGLGLGFWTFFGAQMPHTPKVPCMKVQVNDACDNLRKIASRVYHLPVSVRVPTT